MKRRITHKKITYLLATTASLALILLTSSKVISNASAQTTETQSNTNEITLTAIPPRLGEDDSLTALPGEKIQTAVRVKNGSGSSLKLSTIVQDFIIDEDGETPLPITNDYSPRWSLASWITLIPQKETLLPGETAQIDVVITIPKDALPGGHYAMITHQPQAVGANPNSGSGINQRVGTLIYLRVEGPINEEAFIRNLSLPNFSEFGPVPFTFAIDNQSDIHISPVISVNIFNLFGKQIATIPVETKRIFPFANRSFQGQWDRMWGIGPYTAQVVMTYGSGGTVGIATHRFWLFPITLALSACVLFIVLLGVIFAVIRHLQHRKQNDAKRVQVLEQKLAELEAERTHDQNPDQTS